MTPSCWNRIERRRGIEAASCDFGIDIFDEEEIFINLPPRTAGCKVVT
jgi:hypothetical protein